VEQRFYSVSRVRLILFCNARVTALVNKVPNKALSLSVGTETTTYYALCHQRVFHQVTNMTMRPMSTNHLAGIAPDLLPILVSANRKIADPGDEDRQEVQRWQEEARELFDVSPLLFSIHPQDRSPIPPQTIRVWNSGLAVLRGRQNPA